MIPTDTTSHMDYRQRWEEAARDALTWRKLYEDLWEAIDEYRLWDPRRRGYADARRNLEKIWRGEDPDE